MTSETLLVIDGQGNPEYYNRHKCLLEGYIVMDSLSLNRVIKGLEYKYNIAGGYKIERSQQVRHITDCYYILSFYGKEKG